MRKHFKKIGIGIGIVVAMFASTFFIYVSIYYKATPEALSVLNKPNVSVEADDLIYIASSVRSDTALIFYPGAKVEYTAYLPILEQIVDEVGIDVVLVKMPFNMAIFDQNRALEVMRSYPDIDTWYMGGHSMGGAMASSFSSNHPDDVEGLILMGSYIYGDVDPIEDLKASVENVSYIHIKDKKGERTEWNFPALGEGVIDLGNIHRTSFTQVIESKRAKDIYDGFSNRKAVEELCRKCGYRKKFGA